MIISRHIIHVLDKNNNLPVLNDMESQNSPEIENFYTKLIRKILRDDDLRKAKFIDYETNEIRVSTDHIMYDDDNFVKSSQAVASLLFDSMATDANMKSADLAVVKFVHKEQVSVAIIKLDYKKLFTHEILFDNDTDKVSVDMVVNNIGIQESPKILFAAIVLPSGVNDEYNMMVLDKEAEKIGEDSSFVKDFLKAEKIKDETYYTKNFKNISDGWITNAFTSDAVVQEGVRRVLYANLKDEDSINIQDIADKMGLDENKKESYIEHLEEREIEEEIPVDKDWVVKKLKSRSIKTSSGFTIRGKIDDFEDNMKFSVKKNPDGSFDLVLKNIEFYE